MLKGGSSQFTLSLVELVLACEQTVPDHGAHVGTHIRRLLKVVRVLHQHRVDQFR